MQRKTVFYLKDVEKRLSVMERKLEFIEQADQIRNRDRNDFRMKQNTILP